MMKYGIGALLASLLALYIIGLQDKLSECNSDALALEIEQLNKSNEALKKQLEQSNNTLLQYEEFNEQLEKTYDSRIRKLRKAQKASNSECGNQRVSDEFWMQLQSEDDYPVRPGTNPN